jgi:dienelactone hydrolase
VRIHARVCTALALALVARSAAAQAPERATFYLIVGSDTITVERSERSADRLVFQLFEPRRRAMIEIDAVLGAAGLIERLDERIFASDQDTAPAMRVAVRFDADSVGVDRGGAMNWVRVGRGALPGMNVSAVLLEQGLIRWRALGADSVSIPVMFLPAGPSLPMTILARGSDSAIVRLGAAAMYAAVSPDGRLLGASIPTQNARYVRGPATAGAIAGRKSYAPPAGARYTAQEVSFRTPAGLTLRGTLTLPQGASTARVPAIVTITGSGPQDRDGSFAGLPSYRPYYQLADTLARRGIAVLRLDDRGAGSDAGPPTVTSADLANDVRAAVAWLRERSEVDPRRIGLVGHSEGGTIGPMVAATDSAIAAVVIMGGTVSKGREIVEFQQRFVVDSMAHLLGQQRDAALAQYARNTDSVAAAMPWMRFFLEYDGRPAAGRVRAPVLILHGEKDYQVPVAEADKTAAAVRAGGNRDVTVRRYPGMNHLFLPDAGVGFSYEKLPSVVVPDAVMGAIADWLAARLTR